MARDGPIDGLAPAFRVEAGPGGFFAVSAEHADRFDALGFSLTDDGALTTSDLAGRHPLGELETGGLRFVVRRYRHGGVLRWLTGVRFLDPERPFRELRLARALAERGVRTPEVVAARAQRRAPFGYWLDLVTRRVEGSSDLAVVLEQMRRAELGRDARNALFRAVGAFLGELHALGFEHVDLTPRNLLVERASLDACAPRLWVLDLDGCALGERLEGERRDANLGRLLRALLRRERRGRAFLNRSDYARFARAYAAAVGGGASWKRVWTGVRARYERTLLLHRVGWWFEVALGGGPETRDGGAPVRG